MSMGTGNQRLLTAKFTISVTVDAPPPPWDNVPQCISCYHHLLVVACSLTFVCYVLKEATHLKEKVRLFLHHSLDHTEDCHKPEDEGSANHNPSLQKVGAKVHLSCIQVDYCRDHC